MHAGVEGSDFEAGFFCTSFSLFIFFRRRLVKYSGMVRPCVGVPYDTSFVYLFLSVQSKSGAIFSLMEMMSVSVLYVTVSFDTFLCLR